MTEPVHQIGMTELYNEIRTLSERFTEYIGRHGVESTSVNHRINELERDLAEVKADLKAEHVRRSNTAWQMKLAVASSLIFPIIVAIVTALLVSKG
jgi:hypothetical protein